MASNKIATCYIVHDDHYYFAASLASFAVRGTPAFVFISSVPWHGEKGNTKLVDQIAKKSGAKIIRGEWRSEEEHRAAALDYLLANGFSHALIPDTDEVIEPSLLETLLKLAEQDLTDRAYVQWNTYWKCPQYIIRPREGFTPLLLLKLGAVKNTGLRNFTGGREILVPDCHGVVEHLSYAGPDERILRKISTWGHRDDVTSGWFRKVWKGWDFEKSMRNLHPTHAEAYGFAEKVAVPKTLRLYMPESDIRETPKEVDLPKVTCIVPLCGGPEEIQRCLDSALAIRWHQFIVVDNASPDGATDIVKTHELFTSGSGDTKLVQLEFNRGFAAACNEGAKLATGDHLLFLNSDVVVTRAGIDELFKSLTCCGSVAAAGPLTNECGHGQRVATTYTSLLHVDLFADDFAERDAEDVETDMLTGFCLAVKRSAFEEIGGFDEAFGYGLYEDNDLCYRLRRAGYKLLISAKAFVHHDGSKTIERLRIDGERLLQRNEETYRRKWRDDLESGFASHLSGLGHEPIKFDQGNRPETRLKQAVRRAKRARISGCMIGLNEERVVRDAIRSLRPFVEELIFVDTGSTDRTKEIAAEEGARVIDYAWTDSFSDARNESLKYATGDWVFWMDCDDTLPLKSGEQLQFQAMNAPDHVHGFTARVRFLDGGPKGGTRVDHVKLFRNRPWHRFVGHIHEQIIPSFRPGEIYAGSSVEVLHSGYDASEEGQARKRARDLPLLLRDLADDPKNPFFNFNMGMSLYYWREPERATDWLRKSIDLADSNGSYVRKSFVLLAYSWLQLDKPDLAFDVLREALEKLPDDPEIHFVHATALLGAGDLAAAKTELLFVLGKNTDGYLASVEYSIFSYRTLDYLGEIELKDGNYLEAKKHWIAALEAEPDYYQAIFHLFSAALAIGDFSTANEMLEHIQGREGFGEMWSKLAVVYGSQLAGSDGAISILSQAVGKDPRAALPRLGLSQLLLNAGRGREALPHLYALEQSGFAQAAFFLGQYEAERGATKRARAWYERAAQLDPQHEETQIRLNALSQVESAIA